MLELKYTKEKKQAGGAALRRAWPPPLGGALLPCAGNVAGPCAGVCFFVILLFDTKAPSNKNWVTLLPSVHISLLCSTLSIVWSAVLWRGLRWKNPWERTRQVLCLLGLLQSLEVPACEQ